MSKDGAAKTEENETKVEQQVGEKTKDEHAKIIEEKQKQIEQQTIFYPHFEQIDLNTFEEDIEQIDLSLSRLKEIESFARFTNLKSICFRSNLLKSFLSPHFQVSNGLSKIQELDFYDNQIEKVENLGQFAATLENLDLSFNRFKKIENLDELVNLRRLYFVHNQIAKIEHLDALTKLEMLELGDNQLRVIENLSALKNLKELYLGKNKIKKIENLDLPNLQILSIQSNRLTKIENLEKCSMLEELYLSDNGLIRIEGLDELANLRVIDLANNQIATLENIQHLKKLEEFWFNNNNLAKWESVDVLKELSRLKCLYLEQNPIYYVNNVKPMPISSGSLTQQMNPNYRRKIIFTLPDLEQLDATLISKPSITSVSTHAN